jgi:hypothetical protein
LSSSTALSITTMPRIGRPVMSKGRTPGWAVAAAMSCAPIRAMSPSAARISVLVVDGGDAGRQRHHDREGGGAITSG